MLESSVHIAARSRGRWRCAFFAARSREAFDEFQKTSSVRIVGGVRLWGANAAKGRVADGG